MRLQATDTRDRRQFGLKMIEESDGLVRIICGQMVKDLNNYGLSLPDLFPEGCDIRLYDDFPSLTQSDKGWLAQFDNYIEQVQSLSGQGEQ